MVRSDVSMPKRRQSASRLFGMPGKRALARASVSIMRVCRSGRRSTREQLGVDEAEVERRIVGDERAVAQEVEHLLGVSRGSAACRAGVRAGCRGCGSFPRGCPRSGWISAWKWRPVGSSRTSSRQAISITRSPDIGSRPCGSRCRTGRNGSFRQCLDQAAHRPPRFAAVQAGSYHKIGVVTLLFTVGHLARDDGGDLGRGHAAAGEHAGGLDGTRGGDDDDAIHPAARPRSRAGGVCRAPRRAPGRGGRGRRSVSPRTAPADA